MNERIRELALQAEQYAQANLIERRTAGAPLYAEGEYDSIIKQKFAELIVRECLDVVAMRIYLGPEEICRQECKALASEIKEHFGVEDWLKPFRGEE